MSERVEPTVEVKSSAAAPPWRRMIRNPQDFVGGLALVAFALFAIWASRDLPGMRGIAFGPGTAPRMFAVLLVVLGAAVAIKGLISVGPEIERYAVRGPIFITASILTFAAAIRPLGLVIATFVTILVSAAATPDVRWRESVIVAVFLTLFCALLFPYALNLPMQLWPTWMLQLWQEWLTPLWSSR